MTRTSYSVKSAATTGVVLVVALAAFVVVANDGVIAAQGRAETACEDCGGRHPWERLPASTQTSWSHRYQCASCADDGGHDELAVSYDAAHQRIEIVERRAYQPHIVRLVCENVVWGSTGYLGEVNFTCDATLTWPDPTWGWSAAGARGSLRLDRGALAVIEIGRQGHPSDRVIIDANRFARFFPR